MFSEAMSSISSALATELEPDGIATSGSLSPARRNIDEALGFGGRSGADMSFPRARRRIADQIAEQARYGLRRIG